MVRQSAQLAGDRGQQGVTDDGLRRDQLAELLARQDERLGRLERCRRRRPWGAVEECQFAEHVARAESREDRLVARVRREANLDRAAHDDEQGVSWVAQVEDDLAATESARPDG